MANLTLLGQVRRKLNITWEDEDTTARLEEMIESLIPDMIHMLGIKDPSFDFSEAGVENTLFLAYCLYEWNHALSDFDLNYERMIAQVRAQHEVAYHLANSGDGEDAET